MLVVDNTIFAYYQNLVKIKEEILTVLLGRNKVSQMVVQHGVLSLGLKACPWGGAVHDLLLFGLSHFPLLDFVPQMLGYTKKTNALFDVDPHVLDHTERRNALSAVHRPCGPG